MERTRTAAKCARMKNARVKRAKPLFLIVQGDNLWRFCHHRRRVISRRRKNENVFKVSKDEKCTCKVCKITVFQCADLWGFCCRSRRGCLSSLLGNLRSYDGNCNENVTSKLNFALSLLRLFHVDHVVQNRRIALSLAWYEWF